MPSDREYAAGQRFLLGAKNWWTRTLTDDLRREFEAAHDRAGGKAASVADVEGLVGSGATYRTFAFLERHLQRFKYSGRYGLQAWANERREEIIAGLGDAHLAPGMLHLDPGFEIPKYFRVVDIHQHAGGIWSDPIAGHVYESGARSTTPLAGARHADLHERFTARIAEEGTPERVLDMGCGFGKSTGPFYRGFPGSRVEGIDIAAPCLRLAARNATDARAGNVHFRQEDAAATSYPPGTFNLVTSTMLLHEMPPSHLKKTLVEAYRVLAPGGRMVHLDFYVMRDAFARFLHYTHARRNNEPYMEPLAETDLAALIEEIGFRDVRIEAFAEADGVLDPHYRPWRFPWSVISARK